MYAKISKYDFIKPLLKYLWNMISREGVKLDPSKVQVIVDWTKPKTLQKLWGFLYLEIFYRWFIRNYSSIYAPLTSLTKRDAFKWDEKEEYKFNKLKEAFMFAPILATPNFTKFFTFECNASRLRVGAVLI